MAFGPFTDITTMTPAAALAALGGYSKYDDTAALLKYGGLNPDRQVSADEMNRRTGAIIDLLRAVQATPVGLYVNAKFYGVVADGHPTNTSTDNYAAVTNAVADAKLLGARLVFPPGQYDVYFDSDIFDTTAGKHTCISLDWAGAAVIGAGRDKTILRGKSNKTAVGRVASLVGNTLTLQTASDAAKVRSTDNIRIALGSDGSGARTIGAGSISVEGPVTASANGNGTLGTVPIRNDGGRFQGVTVGDYVFADKAFALFRHNYTSAALTSAFDLTFQDITLDVESYGAVVDPTGDANPILDCPTYAVDSNPQPMGAGTSFFHKVIFDHVKITGAYTQLHFGAGGNLTYAWMWLVTRYCDMADDGMSGVYFGSNDAFNYRTFVSDHTFWHGVHATQGSHLNYINSAANILINESQYDDWRASNFALQNWGGSSTYNRFCHIRGTYYGQGGGGAALLTSEHGSTDFSHNTLECYAGVLVRCSLRAIGNYFCPSAATPNGFGFTTYLDVQNNACITLESNWWNLRNIVATGYTGALVVESPCQIQVRGGGAFSADFDQDTLNDIVPGNTGPFLVVQAGSTGGLITLDGVRLLFGTAAGAGNVSWLATLSGTTGAAVKFRNNTVACRPANDRGVVQCQNRTSSDKIMLEGNDFTVGTNNSKAIYTTSSLPADVISGRNNKFNGAACTFAKRQRLRGCSESAPDQASAATLTLDTDFDTVRLTTTTAVVDIHFLAGESGMDGNGYTLFVPEGWSTTGAGNVNAYGPAPVGGAQVRITNNVPNADGVTGQKFWAN